MIISFALFFALRPIIVAFSFIHLRSVDRAFDYGLTAALKLGGVSIGEHVHVLILVDHLQLAVVNEIVVQVIKVVVVLRTRTPANLRRVLTLLIRWLAVVSSCRLLLLLLRFLYFPFLVVCSCFLLVTSVFLDGRKGTTKLNSRNK